MKLVTDENDLLIRIHVGSARSHEIWLGRVWRIAN
jgi:hypothetical protein